MAEITTQEAMRRIGTDKVLAGVPRYPNEIGMTIIVHVDPKHRGPDMHKACDRNPEPEMHMFEFVQTYWIGSQAVQLWRCVDELYVARIQGGDWPRFCGDIINFPVSYQELFPEHADDATH